MEVGQYSYPAHAVKTNLLFNSLGYLLSDYLLAHIGGGLEDSNLAMQTLPKLRLISQ